MYLKQIIIQGFKSYKDQTIIEPFSPKTNVIVGRNGSGKSNFFAAVRFVLSDAYNQMGREERQALLHEGSGSAVMSAYVEVVFDNSDNRFPTNNPEMVIRRTIGLKKDEYSIDKKVSTKAEVMSMLETAGFSRSNPFYIVPQGRVAALTNMKESERLNLLKEVAGTKTYEARRLESLKIMAETNNKREKIDGLLEDVKERLDELEEEKEELRGFQEKDRERRCLEYAYYHQQETAIQEALDEAEAMRQDGVDNTGGNRKAFMDGEKAISQMESTLNEMQKQLNLLQNERRQLEADRKDHAKARAKAELKVKGLADSQSARDQAKRQHDDELDTIRENIASKEKELSELLPAFSQRKAQELQVRQALDTAEAARNRLLTKQTRSSQFKNKAARDAHLKEQIQEVNLGLGKLKANRMDTDEQVKEAESAIEKLENQLSSLKEDRKGWQDSRAAMAEKVTEAQDRVDQLIDERKLLQREEYRLATMKGDAGKELSTAERGLSLAMDNAAARGLATIRQITQQHDMPGAYGTLAELMEVDEAYRIPVEQTAGNSLFQYVVDNEQTATQLLQELHKRRGGRITCMPLSQLRPRQANLPRANDAIPLVSKIRYDPQFENAFQQVFGRTIVCPNLSIAGQYARSHGVDGITPDGDKASKKGAMTGGFIDPRKSRLEAVRKVTRWRGEFERLAAEADELRDKIERKDQEITQAKGDQIKLERSLNRNGLDLLNADIKHKEEELERERNQLNNLVRRRDATEQRMKDEGENVAAYEAELGTDFKKALSTAEEEQLAELSDQVQQLKREWNEASIKRRETEGQKRILEVDLRQNLRPQEERLSSQAFESSDSVGGGDGSDADAQRELKKAQKAVVANHTQLEENEGQIERANAAVAEGQAEKAAKEEEQQQLARTIEKQQKRMEKSLQRKALLTSQAAECQKNIRNLGVLPEEAFDKYENMKPEQISNRLKRVNEALKKYKHINKKALEQYNNFTTQQDQLLKRRRELDESQASIEELVAHLDKVKDESIERTFKQVSKEFADIFERLVPAGHGRLVIQRKADRRRTAVEESDDDAAPHQRGTVDSYLGVGISVSFNSKTLDEQQRIQQLSGGQKSLCALCLIFALQRAETSPMVIFDEVDANLDAQYRTAVAALLESISAEQGTQFICTTFRPEIVHIADKCYGVTFRNKTSSIDCVPTEDALGFVEGQAAGK